ncbi:hypothetical protein PsW64_04805 [Pseudovibrio sp. W64]|nr:hypothetical protein PsW64_04805 [Pseudovibrio sp. W64]
MYHLEANLQIHYPEDEVYFFDSQNEPLSILLDDGIDILTSVHADLIFADAISRASKWVHNNLTMQIASLKDAKRLKRAGGNQSS